MGATVVLTAMLSILIFTDNYGINVQTMGDHGGWNTTSGVKDHQQKMIINGTINLDKTIFEAISSKINTSLDQAMGR